jgi:hypothetical protein
VAKAPLEIRSLARKHTHKALNTLVSIMVEPKAPAAARIMAANSLLDRGWGKAAQLVDVQGDVKHVVEVKLSVVQARNIDATCIENTSDIKLLEHDAQISNPPA